MPFYLKKGDTFRVTSKEALDLHETLPALTFSANVECHGEYYLQRIDSFSTNGKIYGDTTKRADRIIRTFQDRPISTGVLLAGEKGSGKTLLAKKISIEAAKLKIPTIVVNQCLYGEGFNAFLQSIEQPAIVLFDEFEKVYRNQSDQEAMLTLLDGVYSSKKLFLLTCNDEYQVNCNMKNRPGRIFYLLKFGGLSESFIREYCNDNLHNKDHIENLCHIAALFEAFNFDMLKALVEEMNRYDESPGEVLKLLNARPNFDVHKVYRAMLTINGNVNYQAWRGQPIMKPILIGYFDKKSRKRVSASFSVKDIQMINVASGTFSFANEEKKWFLKLTEIKDGFNIDYDMLNHSPVRSAINPEMEEPITVEDVSLRDRYGVTTMSYYSIK